MIMSSVLLYTLLAYGLLSGTVNIYDVKPSPDILLSLKGCAMQLEILDYREARYVFTHASDYETDIKLVKKRFIELQDAPPASDAWMLPNRACISELLQFNRAYRQTLEDRKQSEVHNFWAIHDAIAETDKAYMLWDKMRDARSEYYYITVRRQALKTLRNEIGPEAYYKQCWPPFVPYWCFRNLDN